MRSVLDRPASSRRQYANGLAVAAMLAGVGGCAVGPNFHRPAAPTVTSYTASPASANLLAFGQDIPAKWWTVYRSPALDALVEQALKSNPDLEAARAALRSAEQTYLAQRGALLPTVGLDYNASKQLASQTISPPLASNANPFTLHTAQVNVSYVLDVFGGVRRQVEQAKAQAEQQRYETAAVYVTLTTNVVAAAIQEASLRGQIDATRLAIKSDRDILVIMRRQLDVGQIARADVAAQETVLAQAEQTLPPLEKQLAQTHDLLADLTGRFPSDEGAQPIDVSLMPLPGPLPVSLPSSLVNQRPDIRAAEANLHAASAGVGIAIAARIPTFTLSANAGGTATQFAQMFDHGNGFWGLTGDVAQPIFQGGALLHRQKAAEAALDQAKAQYRSAVLSAFQNVADSLEALQADDRAATAADTAEARAAESLSIAKRQLQLGQISAPTALLAEQAYQLTRVAKVQADGSRLADSAALFQALGGGWWNRSGV